MKTLMDCKNSDGEISLKYSASHTTKPYQIQLITSCGGATLNVDAETILNMARHVKDQGVKKMISTVYVKVRVTLEHDENVSPEDVINDCEYDFRCPDGTIIDTEIIDCENSVQ